MVRTTSALPPYLRPHHGPTQHGRPRQVRSIVVYVLPLAILFHLLVTYLLYTQLHAG